MDELDLRLFNAIERNPRASFKDLSSLLGITATSVQKRVIELEDSGRILRIVAQLHPDSFGASIGIVHGQTKGVLTKRMVRALQDQGSLRDLGFGAGNQLIGVFVKKSNSDLAELVSILHEVCGIDDPQVLLLGESFYLGKEVKVRFSSNPPSNQLPKLNKTDYRIVLAIHHDARKSYSDIAREVGISTKTAKRRLLNMIEANIIEFKVLKQPTSSMDVHFVINLTLRSRADKGPFLDVLKKIYSERIDRAAFFDSPPKAVVLDGIALTIDELNNIVDGLAKLPEVDVLVPNIILRHYYFDTQLEKMLLEMAT